MTHISKPRVIHPSLERNKLGLTVRDYEGSMSTLCAGCGHDSITTALIEAVWELDVPLHGVAKLSGIGCSSKTPTYFMGDSHGFNAVHGRMPAIGTGASAANKDLVYIGISGDGDSLSIGLGQFCHAIRRNLDMLYVIENNGVYGLTKGQFSASADVGSKAKRGAINQQPPIDSVLLALSMGATFVARSFSGDKKQLVEILKAGIKHPGFALVDVISPCVTFNDHVGSTKSYMYTREHYHAAIYADFVPAEGEIATSLEPGVVQDIAMHDGSVVRFSQIPWHYDPTDRDKVDEYIRERQARGEVVTGLLLLDEAAEDMHGVLGTVDTPLRDLPSEALIPGREALSRLMDEYR